MYSATVLLKINSFLPMSGVWGEGPSIQAYIAPPKDISPGPEPASPIFTTKTKKSGQSIVINVPNAYPGRVQLIYQLPDPRYVLLGLAFRGPNGGVGRVEFRDVALIRDPFGSQMTVTDSCDPNFDNVDFQYVILVQEVATGNIGLIDPDVETEDDDN